MAALFERSPLHVADQQRPLRIRPAASLAGYAIRVPHL
jgi:hypothetical protein